MEGVIVMTNDVKKGSGEILNPLDSKFLTDDNVSLIRRYFSKDSLRSFYKFHQPQFKGTIVTLKQLLDADKTGASQFKLDESKVKAILFKGQSGVVMSQTMFAPIILGDLSKTYVTTGTIDTINVLIISGRHRIAALLTLCALTGLPPEEMNINVLVQRYTSCKDVSLSVLAHNHNRIVCPVERRSIIIYGLTGSVIDNHDTAQSYASKTEHKFLEAFKHYSTYYIQKITEDKDNLLRLKINLPTDVISLIFSKVGRTLLSDERYSPLTNVLRDDVEAWEDYDRLLDLVVLNDVFKVDPKEKNLRRNSKVIKGCLAKFFNTLDRFTLDEEAKAGT
jgi:hypothetical protein